MTKTPFGRSGEGARQCSAIADFHGRKGSCRNDARYPDGDGVRWWCEEHRPVKKAAFETSPGSAVASGNTPAEIALERAQRTLDSIASMKPVGWVDRPAFAYETLIDEMCSLAKSTSDWIRREMSK